MHSDSSVKHKKCLLAVAGAAGHPRPAHTLRSMHALHAFTPAQTQHTEYNNMKTWILNYQKNRAVPSHSFGHMCKQVSVYSIYNMHSIVCVCFVFCVCLSISALEEDAKV